ncbi:MAG: ABC-F type ribosomal protection protein [Firmicutes bacterium]|nr:ABC-F type ribosomal protection protein [Bacillota bacterium]
MIACSVNQVGKMYGGNSIFEHISFEIQENDRVGLVGRNGSGKTTLFRLLAGEEAPDTGEIHWKKGTEIGYLVQVPDFHREFTTHDVLKTAFSELLQKEEQMRTLELAMNEEKNGARLQRLLIDYGDLQEHFVRAGGYEIEANISRVVSGLHLDALVSQLFSTLSGGEKTKVSLALTLLKKPSLLLLDEPTNHLDLMAVEWLGNFLYDYSGTVVVVSHDRYFLDEVVNKIFDLEDGEIQCYQTNFSGFVTEKEEHLLAEFHAYAEQQKKIKKIKEAIKRLRDWASRANPGGEGLYKKARNMERALERMEKLNRPILQRKKMKLTMEAAVRSGNDVIMLQGVSKGFSQELLFQHVDMHVRYQQRVAIVGENGTGKSTLLKLILGQLAADEGVIRLGSNVKIGYLSQQIFSEIADETVIETFRAEVRVSEGDARQILAKFLFYDYMVFRKVSQLSGGECMRLRLAQLMYQDINLLVLDEPTNHLDIESREVLEDTLADFTGTILAVTHDRYFLNTLFDTIYWLEAKRVHCFTGDYNWAKEKMAEIIRKRQRLDEGEKSDAVATKVVQQARSAPHVNVEAEIKRLEVEIEEVDKTMAETLAWESLQQLYKKKEKLEQQWEELYQLLGE